MIPELTRRICSNNIIDLEKLPPSCIVADAIAAYKYTWRTLNAGADDERVRFFLRGAHRLWRRVLAHHRESAELAIRFLEWQLGEWPAAECLHTHTVWNVRLLRNGTYYGC